MPRAADNISLLAAAVVTMAVAVVTINRLFWKRLYRMAEDRYQPGRTELVQGPRSKVQDRDRHGVPPFRDGIGPRLADCSCISDLELWTLDLGRTPDGRLRQQFDLRRPERLGRVRAGQPRRAGRRLARCRAQRNPGDPGPQRMRQEHARPRDGRTDPPDAGRSPRPRQTACGAAPGHRAGLSEFRAFSLAHGPAERRNGAGRPRRAGRGGPRARRAVHRYGRAGRPPGRLSQGALRRDETARRNCAGHGPCPRTVVHGRAVQRARRLHGREPAQRNLQPVDRPRRCAGAAASAVEPQKHRHDHAPDRRGRLSGRPHRDHGDDAGTHPANPPQHAPPSPRLPVADISEDGAANPRDHRLGAHAGRARGPAPHARPSRRRSSRSPPSNWGRSSD